jgi:enoyl-CoA hydratase
MNPETVVVVGAGTMGLGIAQNLLEIGVMVHVCDAIAASAEAARGRIEAGLLRRYKADADPAARAGQDLARLDVHIGLADGVTPWVVIEAVPEIPALKASVLADIERAYPAALVASNTSSLSIDGLSEPLARPESFVGMHFFNPVPTSTLVEVVVGKQTADAVAVQVRDLAKRMGKESILVHDAPGFATSRLGLALGLEAIRMVEAGVASPEDIDTGMTSSAWTSASRSPRTLRRTSAPGSSRRNSCETWWPPASWARSPAKASTPGTRKPMTLLRVTRTPGVLHVGLDRPEKRNAMDLALVDEFHQVLNDAARAEPAVMILSSTTPGIFVSGADIAELRDRRADDALQGINSGICQRLSEYRWPSIAVIDGAALGGGCELAMACDFRIGTPNAKFGQPELNLGILAGAGGNWRLAQLVGLAAARKLLYTGAILDAEAAQAAGILDEIHSAEAIAEAAAALAATIAKRSWRALELTKLALRLHQPSTTTFDITAQALLFESQDKHDRMTTFLTRKKP